MNVQRATALLLYRRNHFTTVGGQHADGCFVNIAENLVHNAATDKANPIARFPNCRGDFWQCSWQYISFGIVHQCFGYLEFPLERSWKSIGCIKQTSLVN